MRRIVSNPDRIHLPTSGFRWARMVIPVLGLISPDCVWAGDDALELTPPLDSPAVMSLPRLVNPTRLPIISAPTPAPAPIPIPLPTHAPVLEAESLVIKNATPSAVLDLPPSSSALRAVPAIPGLRPRFGELMAMPTFSTDDSVHLEPLGGSESESAGLTLDGPIEMRNAPLPSRRGRPIPFAESGPNGNNEVIPLSDPMEVDRGLLGDAALGRPSSASRRPDSGFTNQRDAIRSTSPTPRRRFFGLFPGPAVANPIPAPVRSSTVGISGLNSLSDPDQLSPEAIADFRLKQRIEKQARESVGDHVRTLDVQVKGKSATIHARGVRFYQKRSVRRALEGLPALTGLRSMINLDD